MPQHKTQSLSEAYQPEEKYPGHLNRESLIFILRYKDNNLNQHIASKVSWLLSEITFLRFSLLRSTLITFYKCTRLSLSELLMTETELKLIAAAAIMGDSNMPKNGYSNPAATGTPAEL